MDRKSGKEQIELLVNNFSTNDAYYLSNSYNEAQCRIKNKQNRG
jgi:hypothetical protein